MPDAEINTAHNNNTFQKIRAPTKGLGDGIKSSQVKSSQVKSSQGIKGK
jgi:hypothetical protein